MYCLPVQADTRLHRRATRDDVGTGGSTLIKPTQARLERNTDEKTKNDLETHGGDIAGCLSSGDIDKIISHLTIFPADTFFRLRRGDVTAAQIRAEINKRKTGITVIHVRHHWVLAEFANDGWTVYDSARSAPVSRDLHKLAIACNLPPPHLPEAPQQFVGSNECGLFVVMNAMLRHRHMHVPQRADKVSLAEMRRVFPDAHRMFAIGCAAYGLQRSELERRGLNIYGVREEHGRSRQEQEKNRTGQHNPYAQVTIIRGGTVPRDLTTAPRLVTQQLVDAIAKAKPQCQQGMRVKFLGRLTELQEEFTEGYAGIIIEAAPRHISVLLDEGGVVDIPSDKWALHTLTIMTDNDVVVASVGDELPSDRLDSLVDERKAGLDTATRLRTRTSWYNDDIMSQFTRLLTTQYGHDKQIMTLSPLLAAKVMTDPGRERLKKGTIEALTGARLILWPININSNHWILLSIERCDRGDSRTERSISVYDPLGPRIRTPHEVQTAIDLLVRHKITSTRNACIREGPGQRNSYDCGPFVLMMAYQLTLQVAGVQQQSSGWGQTTMEYIRTWIAACMASQAIVPFQVGRTERPPAESHPHLPDCSAVPTIIQQQDNPARTTTAAASAIIRAQATLGKGASTPATTSKRLPPISNSPRGRSREALSRTEESANARHTAWTSAAVNRFVEPLKLGASLAVTWSEPHGKELYTWLGTLARKKVYGLRPVMSYTHTKCTCGRWQVMSAEDLKLYAATDLPFKSFPIWGIEPTSAGVVDCTCGQPGAWEKTLVKKETPIQLSTGTSISLSRLCTKSALVNMAQKLKGLNKLLQVTIAPSAATKAASPASWEQSSVEKFAKDNTVTCVGHVMKSNNSWELAVSATRCARCHKWVAIDHDEEDPEDVVVSFPDAAFIYRDVEALEALPEMVRSCGCDGPQEELLEEGVNFRAFRDELKPDASLAFATRDSPHRATVVRDWFVHSGKPPMVHSLTWRRLAASTRASHARWLRMLKAIPKEWERATLGWAAVQLVLVEAERAKWTSWATVSSALSSIASACRRLPEYTNSLAGFDLAEDICFDSAARRAQQLARVTKRHPTSSALTDEQYARVSAKIKDTGVRLLFDTAWFFAGRVGDIRQLLGGDVTVGPEQQSKIGEECAMVTGTFRSGKGAAFWGPYTVQTMVTMSVAKGLSGLIRQQGPNNQLFTERQQTELSKYLQALVPGTDLRAIRRGRLQSLAAAGSTNEELRLLSGHKRVDTLLRYLGWGRFSSDAREAAAARGEVDPSLQSGLVYGGHSDAYDRCTEPPKMGPYSGYGGFKGRRIRKPSQDYSTFVPLKPPKARELGLEVPRKVSDMWPLKAKSIPTLCWLRMRTALSATAHDQHQHLKLGNDLLSEGDWQVVQDKLTSIQAWCEGEPLAEALGIRRTFRPEDIPLTHASRKDFNLLRSVEKLAEFEQDDQILGWAVGHTVPQTKTLERRPVWEGQINREDLWIPQIRYPSRRVRRMIKGFGYTADFDFRNWFDQFALSKLAQQFHVCRYRIHEEDGSTSDCLMKLTRLPMGDRQAPGIAQYLTDVLIAPLLRMGNVKTFTMIDNVRICARNQDDYLRAVHVFLERVEQTGALLNDVEWPAANLDELTPGPRTPVKDMSDEDWITYGLRCGKIFLGEQYLGEFVRNAPKNVEKVHRAWERLHEAVAIGDLSRYTIRNLVAFIALLFWMAHTLDIHMCQMHAMLDTYAKLSTRAHFVGWDSPLEFVDARLLDKLDYWSSVVTRNTPVPMPLEPGEPSTDLNDYDVLVVTDASGVGWAALVQLVASGKTVCLRQAWPQYGRGYERSTVAEPAAVAAALHWVRDNIGSARIALVTDHSAVVTGQARWWNSNGGFSQNYYLNEAFRVMTELGVQAWFIPGEVNPADDPSRHPPRNAGQFEVTEVHRHVILPVPLSSLQHPFIGKNCAEDVRMMG